MIILFYLSFIWLAIEFWLVFKNRANQSFRRAKIALFTWFSVNILSFLMKTKYEYAADQIFPFDSDNIANYDYAEIFIYILLPILIWYFFKPKTKFLNSLNELNNSTQIEIRDKRSLDVAALITKLKIFSIKLTKYIIIPLSLITLIYYVYERKRIEKIEKNEQNRIDQASIMKENYYTLDLDIYFWKTIKLKTKYEEGTLKFVVDIVFDNFTKSEEKYVLKKINSINILLKDYSGFNIKEITLLTSRMTRIQDGNGSYTGYNFQGEFNELSLTQYEKIVSWDFTYQVNPDIKLNDSVQMLNLIGLTLAEAKFLLIASNLKLEKIIDSENILNSGDAFVIDQNHKPLTIIPLEQGIEITISKHNPLVINTSSNSDSNGNYSNSNILDIELETKNFEYFTLGSSRETVLSVQGTPTKLSKFRKEETLHYMFDEVIFENGVVVDYNNTISNQLKIRLVPKNKSLNTFFTIGSTIENVLSIQGTPTKLSKFGNEVTLHYMFDEVIFKNGVVVDYNNTISNQLKVRL